MIFLEHVVLMEMIPINSSAATSTEVSSQGLLQLRLENLMQSCGTLSKTSDEGEWVLIHRTQDKESEHIKVSSSPQEGVDAGNSASGILQDKQGSQEASERTASVVDRQSSTPEGAIATNSEVSNDNTVV